MLKRLSLLVASLLVLVAVAPAAPALADTNVFDSACSVQGAPKSSACNTNSPTNPLTGPNGTITKVTKLIGFISGVAAVILITVGGMMYIISGGDASKVASAKNTVIYAAVGLVIVVSAQSIIIFILNRL